MIQAKKCSGSKCKKGEQLDLNDIKEVLQQENQGLKVYPVDRL
jgi:hypothetical protein